jgi:hypothetical protein
VLCTINARRGYRADQLHNLIVKVAVAHALNALRTRDTLVIVVSADTACPNVRTLPGNALCASLDVARFRLYVRKRAQDLVWNFELRPSGSDKTNPFCEHEVFVFRQLFRPHVPATAAVDDAGWRREKQRIWIVDFRVKEILEFPGLRIDVDVPNTSGFLIEHYC